MFVRCFERLIHVGGSSRSDGSLVAALAELLGNCWANHVFLLMFDTVKEGLLFLFAFPRWSKFTVHCARTWSRIISGCLDWGRTEREREKEEEAVTLLSSENCELWIS